MIVFIHTTRQTWVIPITAESFLSDWGRCVRNPVSRELCANDRLASAIQRIRLCRATQLRKRLGMSVARDTVPGDLIKTAVKNFGNQIQARQQDGSFAKF